MILPDPERLGSEEQDAIIKPRIAMKKYGFIIKCLQAVFKIPARKIFFLPRAYFMYSFNRQNTIINNRKLLTLLTFAQQEKDYADSAFIGTGGCSQGKTG